MHGLLFLSPVPLATTLTSLLSFLVWTASQIPSSHNSGFLQLHLSDLPSSPAHSSLPNYFTLSYMIISVWIMLLLSLPALTYLCAFSIYVILLNIC